MDRDVKRLHICLGTGCNNHCVFCMESDRDSRERRLSHIDEATARTILAQAPSRDEVMFTAGEPTLRPDLPALVDYARELEFGRIGLVTNGRRLSYADYARGLVRRGLNEILVSIHGHTARLHDALTRTPGSFAQTAAGLRNACELRREFPSLRVVATTVLNRRNLPHLREHLAFLRTFAPDQVVFNVIQPVGGGDRHFRTLVPRYTEVAQAFAEMVAEVPGAEGVPVFLLDIPRCAARGVPESFLGFVEKHRHFEPEQDIMAGVAEGGDAMEREGKDRLRLVTKEALDSVLRHKEPSCRRCRFDAACDGVWKRYVEVFGFAEFEPAGAGEERQ